MTGPQATDQPHTPPVTVAQRLQGNGVRIYPVAVGPRKNQNQVLALANNADDVTYVPSFRQLRPAAAAIAPVASKGKSVFIFCLYSFNTIRHYYDYLSCNYP